MGKILSGQYTLLFMFNTRRVIKRIKIGTITKRKESLFLVIIGKYENNIGIKGEKNIAYLYAKGKELADTLLKMTLRIVSFNAK